MTVPWMVLPCPVSVNSSVSATGLLASSAGDLLAIYGKPGMLPPKIAKKDSVFLMIDGAVFEGYSLLELGVSCFLI
ncbi:MAG: hypothetical protein WAT67_03070 [Candidatus Contendobacter sp.]